MLYQLSYEPQTAGAVGLEPTTFEVEARHSIQLSYAPMFFVNARFPTGIALNIKNYPFNGINLLKLKQKQREW